MFNFLVNKTPGHVSLFEGKVLVPAGGHKEITAEEAKHPDIADAIRRGWLALVHKVEELTGNLPPAPPAPEVAPVEEGTTVFPSNTPEPAAEAKAEVAPEVAPEPVPEAKPAKSKKVAAEPEATK